MAKVECVQLNARVQFINRQKRTVRARCCCYCCLPSPFRCFLFCCSCFCTLTQLPLLCARWSGAFVRAANCNKVNENIDKLVQKLRHRRSVLDKTPPDPRYTDWPRLKIKGPWDRGGGISHRHTRRLVSSIMLGEEVSEQGRRRCPGLTLFLRH